MDYFMNLARSIADERQADALAGAALARRPRTAPAELVCVDRSGESPWGRQGCLMVPAGWVA